MKKKIQRNNLSKLILFVVIGFFLFFFTRDILKIILGCLLVLFNLKSFKRYIIISTYILLISFYHSNNIEGKSVQILFWYLNLKYFLFSILLIFKIIVINEILVVLFKLNFIPKNIIYLFFNLNLLFSILIKILKNIKFNKNIMTILFIKYKLYFEILTQKYSLIKGKYANFIS